MGFRVMLFTDLNIGIGSGSIEVAERNPGKPWLVPASASICSTNIFDVP
jgi:hypothetical protein